MKWVTSLNGLISPLIQKRRQGKLFGEVSWTPHLNHLQWPYHSLGSFTAEIRDNKMLICDFFFFNEITPGWPLHIWIQYFSLALANLTLDWLSCQNQNWRHSQDFRLGPQNLQCKNYRETIRLLCRYNCSPLAGNPVLLVFYSFLALDRWIRLDLWLYHKSYLRDRAENKFVISQYILFAYIVGKALVLIPINILHFTHHGWVKSVLWYGKEWKSGLDHSLSWKRQIYGAVFLLRKREYVTTFFKSDSNGRLPVVWKRIAAFILVHFFPRSLKSWLFDNFSTVSFTFSIAVPRIKIFSNIYLLFSVQRTMWFKRKSKDLNFFSLCCLQVMPVCVGLCRNVFPS